MYLSRRSALLSIAASAAQAPNDPTPPHPTPEPEDDEKLPNGKSRRDAMAKHDHNEALKDAGQLVTLATEIKTELEKAGDFVVPLTTLKKTEDIEKLARKIRSRLKN